jgi:anti-sigma regulatory factor (Ser/Thr protein kinase)
MNTVTYDIPGGDLERAGDASKQLKEVLKRLGADPRAVRRTMIAAYEAEMNVVIHAGSGRMKAAVKPTQVDVAVIDEGPGIPDLDLALKEGYSTAPAAARELGFGAGMGLPNIKRNTDRLTIQSTPGKGTQLRFSVLLQPLETVPEPENSLSIDFERCRLSLRCVHACPTGAIRVRGGGPHILDHLCVDCTACTAACPAKVFGIEDLDPIPEPSPDTVLILPNAFVEQFGPGVSLAGILEALRGLGFERVYLTAGWEEALRAEALRYAHEHPAVKPVFSPVCPAALNLIAMRFPSLLGHVAPYLSTMETVRETFDAPHLAVVPACAAHRTILRASSAMAKIDAVSPAALRNAVQPLLRGRTREEPGPPAPAPEHEILEVWGMPAMMALLEHAENGFLSDIGVVEMYACAQGCFGAPVWTADPYAARNRFEKAWEGYRGSLRETLIPPEATALRRIVALQPRSGMRLDPDMRKAMEKLGRIDTLTWELPGRDCGVCGAPTCAALAEDIVLERAAITECPYRHE